MSDTKTRIMVDIETLGVNPGCKILSIGAVVSSSYIITSGLAPWFYVRIIRESQPMLYEEEDTLEWWNRQSVAARSEAFSGDTSLNSALLGLSDWLYKLPKNYTIWSNGATFDLPILSTAYEVMGLPRPWKYTQERCFRTLREEFKELAKTATIPDAVTKHNALDDAIKQAIILETILAGLKHGR